MYEYRKTLYQEYYQTQAGRRSEEDLGKQMRVKLAEDAWLLHQEITPLLPPVAQQPNIIDIGCGFGSWVYALQQYGYNRTKGIDVSPSQVAVALDLGITSVEQADLLPYLQQHPDTFDVITGIDIVEHFAKDELVTILGAIKQALRKDGIAVFRTPNADSLFSSLYMYGDFTHETILNQSSAQQLLYSIGFSKVSVNASCMNTPNAVKNVFRRVVWQIVSGISKAVIFASGRSSRGLVLSPNIIISARK
jgi:2-polyprenyl-3-methyl-5-hydroxy-6-metoxy-1,4-benzoquinol methylase